MTQLDDPEEEGEESIPSDAELRCGIGACRPRWMQVFADIKAYVVSYSLAAMVSSALGIYMISQVTTFEKLLGLSSKETGFLLSANDIGYLIVIVFASHLGRKANTPFILGCLITVFGVMAMICSIPHFIMASYRGLFYVTADVVSESTGETNAAAHVTLCNANRTSSVTSQEQQDNDTIAHVRRISFIILSLSLMVQGAVKAPRYPLSITFVDDHVPKTKLGLYSGVIVAIIILGLALSTGLSSVFSQMFATLEDVTITKQDPRWVGAWWLGFLVIGIGAAVFAMPMLLFPKYLPSHRLLREKEDTEQPLKVVDEKEESKKQMEISDTRKRSNVQAKKLFKQEAKDFPRAMFRLLKNPVYMTILAANGIGTLGHMGRMVYFPKYLEVHFNVLPHQAIFMFGITILVGAGLGGIAGGAIVSIFKMSPKNTMIFAIVIGTLSTSFSFIGLSMRCDQRQFSGYNISRLIPNTEHHPNHTNYPCVDACTCEDKDYLPICGDDGETYFSPCHAGCLETHQNSKTFSNCSCMPGATNHTATAGTCGGQCPILTIYLVLAFLGPLFAMLAVSPKIVVKMRCVSEEDRSLSVGVNAFVVNLLGPFLSPIIVHCRLVLSPIMYGWIIDMSCALWDGHCKMYDIADFRYKLHVTSGSIGPFLSPIMYGWIIDKSCVLWDGHCKMYDIADFRYKLHVTSGSIGVVSDILYIIALVIVLTCKRYRTFFDAMDGDDTKKPKDDKNTNDLDKHDGFEHVKLNSSEC